MLAPVFNTLRFRLTMWNTAVLLLASLLAFGAVREAMRWTLINETKDLLREEATELRLAIEQLSSDAAAISDEFERKIAGHSRHAWFAGLTGNSGESVWASESFPADEPALQEFWQEDPSDQDFVFGQSPQNLWVKHRVQDPAGGEKMITLGTPLSFVSKDVQNLTKILLVIGGVLILIAPIGGYILARNATQPVRDIIEITRSLDPEHLNTRLKIRNTGDELDQISAEINLFVDQIANYLKIHREFIANAAHELRSPLTAIQTSVEVTLEKSRSNQVYREELETVNEHCEQLRHLVNQLLQLTETDAPANDEQRKPVNFSAVVLQSVDFFHGIAEESNIQLITLVQKEVYLSGDALKLHQVINNLLDNALKFTPAQGRVETHLKQSESGGIYLTILDSGCGIPESAVERVFERFYQVDPARQRSDRRGNGLGLSICKSIVQWHGGQIKISQRPSGGTAVSVVFPATSENET